MAEEQDRVRQAPDVRLAGPEHRYDLAAEAAGLRTEGSAARNGHRQITIVHEGSTSFVLFDFEAGGQLNKHSADGLVTIHALEGRIRVTTSDAEHQLDAGTLLVLSPNVEHDLYAVLPSQVLLSVHLR